MSYIPVFNLAKCSSDPAPYCDCHGLYLAGIPLLRSVEGNFHPRRPEEISGLLDNAYGMPGQGARIMGGLQAVCNALNEGKLAQAQVAALFLKLSPLDAQGVARMRRAAHILAKYDASEARDWHGRWTADGDRDSPTQAIQTAGAPRASMLSADTGPVRATPAQAVMPFPPEQILPLEQIPWLEQILPIPPFPPDILPPLADSPDIASPRGSAEQPYPTDPDCAREWREARNYCQKLIDEGLLGRGKNRNSGKTLMQCMRGQVSQRCGGNSTTGRPWVKPKPKRPPSGASSEIFA